MANFNATKGGVFKQCAAKGRVLNTKCVPERVYELVMSVHDKHKKVNYNCVDF